MTTAGAVTATVQEEISISAFITDAQTLHEV